MGGGQGNSTCREFVVGGLRLFGGMLLVCSLMPAGMSAFVIFDYVRSLLDASHAATDFTLNDTPVSLFRFVCTLTIISAFLLATGAFMIRFSMSKLMNKLDNQPVG